MLHPVQKVHLSIITTHRATSSVWVKTSSINTNLDKLETKAKVKKQLMIQAMTTQPQHFVLNKLYPNNLYMRRKRKVINKVSVCSGLSGVLKESGVSDQ